jgi:hypothetical protein
MFTAVGVSCTTVSARGRAIGAGGAPRSSAARHGDCTTRPGMNSATIAWLITGAAGLASGVIAGVQHRVTTESVIAIAVVIPLASGAVARVRPRDEAHA